MALPPESLADALFSRTRKAAIGLLFAQPARSVHLRELARLAAVSPAMMAKELDALCAAGLVLQRRDGNRRLFGANPASPIFDELAGIARKTAGLADVLRQALAGLEAIELAFVFGSAARGAARADSDVDLWVVGRCDYAALLQACAAAGERLGLTATASCYRLTRNVAFVRAEAHDGQGDTPVATAQAAFMLGTPGTASSIA